MACHAVAGDDVYVGLGSNLGDSAVTLAAAFDALGRLPESALIARSSLYRSAPVDATGPDFINAVAHLRSTLSPHALLGHLLRIEAEHGRQRLSRHAPRTLDLDLLVHGSQRIAEAGLTVPHPRLHERAFVLRPLAEIAPVLEISGLGSVAALASRVAGQRVDRLS